MPNLNENYLKLQENYLFRRSHTVLLRIRSRIREKM